jgi:hypothetical protein
MTTFPQTPTHEKRVDGHAYYSSTFVLVALKTDADYTEHEICDTVLANPLFSADMLAIGLPAQAQVVPTTEPLQPLFGDLEGFQHCYSICSGNCLLHERSDPPVWLSQVSLEAGWLGQVLEYSKGRTHGKGKQNPSKWVPIFLGGTEANLKMVPIQTVPKSRPGGVVLYICVTVCYETRMSMCVRMERVRQNNWRDIDHFAAGSDFGGFLMVNGAEKNQQCLGTPTVTCFMI